MDKFQPKQSSKQVHPKCETLILIFPLFSASKPLSFLVFSSFPSPPHHPPIYNVNLILLFPIPIAIPGSVKLVSNVSFTGTGHTEYLPHGPLLMLSAYLIGKSVWPWIVPRYWLKLPLLHVFGVAVLRGVEGDVPVAKG
jgi:hypothetical protein